jgi:thymidylate synthase (FAD)
MKISEMSVQLIDSMGSDLSVCNAARVSFAKESALSDGLLQERDEKLITYLSTHGHWSPFAHAFLTFRIKAPIFVARQLVKHQVGLSWNEVSRRYVDDEPEWFLPSSWRSRPETNMKQGSGKETITEIVGLPGQTPNDEVLNALESCLTIYQSLLDSGVAPEQARMILPQNMMTEWIWSGSLMAFARVCKQRLDPHAQQETRVVAQAIDLLVPKEFQHSWKALK